MAARRILVVDDDVDFLEEMTDILKSYGFEPIAVNDSAAVQDIVRLLKPDAILLDVKMSGLTGFQVKDRLSQDLETMGIPVIAVTGSYGGKDRRYLMNTLGVGNCIMKPFAPQELVDAIESILVHGGEKQI